MLLLPAYRVSPFSVEGGTPPVERTRTLGAMARPIYGSWSSTDKAKSTLNFLCGLLCITDAMTPASCVKRTRRCRRRVSRRGRVGGGDLCGPTSLKKKARQKTKDLEPRGTPASDGVILRYEQALSCGRVEQHPRVANKLGHPHYAPVDARCAGHYSMTGYCSDRCVCRLLLSTCRPPNRCTCMPPTTVHMYAFLVYAGAHVCPWPTYCDSFRCYSAGWDRAGH